MKTSILFKIIFIVGSVTGIAVLCANKTASEKVASDYVVAATFMNVMYVGPDNPLKVCVGDFPANKVKVTAAGCGVSIKEDARSGPGNYIATVNSSGEVNVFVNVEKNGKLQELGAPYTFRVKKIPNPQATLNGMYHGGPVSKEILSSSNVIPVMENFDFKLYYVITGFKMSIYGAGKEPVLDLPSDGNQFSEKMRSTIRSLRTGDKVFIDMIKVRMTCGTDMGLRNLEPLMFIVS
jgi:hypothetical protein